MGHWQVLEGLADGRTRRAPLGADPKAFLEEVEPLIHDKLEEEIKALNGVKFQLALKVQLRKDSPDGSEEYTDPVLRHKQEALLQNNEIEGGLDQAFSKVQDTLEKWTQRGSWLGCRSGEDPLARQSLSRAGPTSHSQRW